MKRIIKKEPEFFQKYIHDIVPKDWAILSKDIGFNIREYILKGDNGASEQNNQCAYTELAIKPDLSNSHIDHYRKRSLYSTTIFDWNNLFVACNSEFYGAKYKDKQIKSGNKAIYESLLNPSIDNPKDFFYYSLTGEISPRSKDKDSDGYKKAKTTIDVFNLNHKSLVNRRKTVVVNISSLKVQYELGEILDYINEFDTFVEEVYASL